MEQTQPQEQPDVTETVSIRRVQVRAVLRGPDGEVKDVREYDSADHEEVD